MIDPVKIHLAETPTEIFELTQTTNLVDAEKKVIDEYEMSMHTRKAIFSRIFYGILGVYLVYTSSLFFLLFPLGLFLLYLSFFMKRSGSKQIRKKFTELRAHIKALDGYPELVFEKNVATFIPRSALGSQAAKINGVGQLYMNADSTKHLWQHAGFCRIAMGESTSGRAEWQQYYVFAYEFHGSIPQTVMIHNQDRFSIPESPDNKILTDICPPWQTVVAEQYEIESLAVLTQEVLSELTILAGKNPPCTLEFFESKLLCFIPVDTTDLNGLLVLEETADSFARVLIPNLKRSRVTMIGNIPPFLALDIDIESNYEEDIPLTASEKTRSNWMIIAVILFVIIFLGGIIASNVGMFSPNFFLPLPIVFVILIYFIMPKRLRSQWLKGSGFRINGRKVIVRRETK